MKLKKWDIAWLVLMSIILIDLAVDMELRATSEGAVFMAAIQLLKGKPNELN